MVQQANALAFKEALGDRFVSIEANANLLPFNDNEYNYAIAYGVFRYIDSSDYKKTLSEISRVTNRNFTIAESILRELIYTLKDSFALNEYSIKETTVSMFRVSLFYMLFKEYKRNNDFKILIDGEIENGINAIEALTSVAGMASGILYELRVCNRPIYF
jgi:ubiquinone/menaquinone biosynthesis C-methylase UbiE